MALEQETDTILRILAEKTIADRDSCRLETVMSADVPRGIKSFFRAETRRKLEQDLKKSSWFNGIRRSDAAPARIAQTLLLSLTDAYQFNRQEFLDTLDLAVHFVANYLCRPQWTLENFLFDRTPEISLQALEDGLAYVADYRYLGDLALRSLQRRGQAEIGREDFRMLVEKIDNEVVRQHSARELAALARPLFSFFQVPGPEPDDGIPVSALLLFFEDKKLRTLKEYLRGICHLRSQSRLTFDELTKLIEDLTAGKTATQPEPVPSEPEVYPSVSAADVPEPLPEVQVPPATQASAGTEVPPVPEVPLEKPAPEPPAAPAPARATAPGDAQKVNIALSLTFAGLRGNVAPRQLLPELRTLIQPEQRDRFVTQVFKGDAAHFAGALAMLDSLKTWPEAESYLQELYRTNHLDPNAADAVEFSETIRKRYDTIEKVP